MPGVTEHLNRHWTNDDTCRLVRRALKLNYVTKWGNGKRDKFNEKCFSRFIELAMPKLKSQLDVRIQNGANANGNGNGSHNNGTVSNGLSNGVTNGHGNGSVRSGFPL